MCCSIERLDCCGSERPWMWSAVGNSCGLIRSYWIQKQIDDRWLCGCAYTQDAIDIKIHEFDVTKWVFPSVCIIIVMSASQLYKSCRLSCVFFKLIAVCFICFTLFLLHIINYLKNLSIFRMEQCCVYMMLRKRRCCIFWESWYQSSGYMYVYTLLI